MSHCDKNKPIFEMKNVTLGYDKKNIIVHNISLNINEGEFVSIIGPNGSGKSTILRAMAKILHPKKGVILFNGKEINFNLRQYFFQQVIKFYKLPFKLIHDIDIEFNINENKNFSKKEINSLYYFAKAWAKAKALGFNEKDLFISTKKLVFTKLIEKTMKFAKMNNITLEKELIFNPLYVEHDINRLNELKVNDIEQYQIILLNTYASKFKPNTNDVIYSQKIYKNKFINKITKYLKSKKIVIDKDYFMTKENPFLNNEYLNSTYVIDSLKKLKKWKIFFKLDKNYPLYGFESLFYSSKEYAKYVSFVPQITSFPNEITVEEFVKMGRYPHNKILNFFDQEHDKTIVEKALINVNLLELKDKYIDDLSGGQKQRAIIALALAQDTNTILLDEPTNHLDIKHQLEIIHLLHDLNHKLNKTIVLVIHDINHGMKFSDKVIVMDKGNVVAYGPTNKVINKNVIKNVFGVDAKFELSQNKKIITDYWIENLDLLKEYHSKEDKCN